MNTANPFEKAQLAEEFKKMPRIDESGAKEIPMYDGESLVIYSHYLELMLAEGGNYFEAILPEIVFEDESHIVFKAEVFKNASDKLPYRRAYYNQHKIVGGPDPYAVGQAMVLRKVLLLAGFGIEDAISEEIARRWQKIEEYEKTIGIVRNNDGTLAGKTVVSSDAKEIFENFEEAGATAKKASEESFTDFLAEAGVKAKKPAEAEPIKVSSKEDTEEDSNNLCEEKKEEKAENAETHADYIMKTEDFVQEKYAKKLAGKKLSDEESLLRNILSSSRGTSHVMTDELAEKAKAFFAM